MVTAPLITNEAFYHFVWQNKLFNTENLKTECGLSVELIHPGFLNSDAGPDFFNAKIKLDGILWAGNIEIHTKSSDWETHHHHNDKKYDNVILHVIANYSEEIKNSQGRTIPSLVIQPFSYVFANYESLFKQKQVIACSDYLPQIDPLFWTNFRDRLATERLERKSSVIKKMIAQNNNWDDIFFKTLCRSFGFGVNSDAFERLGNSLSSKIIAKHRDHLIQLEALLLGQAGFLESDHEDPYFQTLKKEYQFLKAKYDLVPLEVYVWKFLRLRPSNFPTIRLAQLAFLLHQNDSLLHHIINSDLKTLEKSFKGGTSLYWNTHYQFGKLSNKRIKTLGTSAVRTLLINTVSPLLFSYGKNNGQEELCDKALNTLEELPSEKNHIITLWENRGLSFQSAYDSQALLQLYNEYCLKRRCMHCNIGHHYVSLHH